MASSNSTHSQQSPATMFASMFPRLRLVKQCGDDFGDISIDGAAADLIDTGLLTQAMLDALPRCGRKDFHVTVEGNYRAFHVRKVKAGFRVNLWGSGGPMTILRERLGIKAKPAERSEPLSSEADISAIEDWIEEFGGLVGRLGPRTLKHEIGKSIGHIEGLLSQEKDRIAEQLKSKERPILRLVVNNEARQ